LPPLRLLDPKTDPAKVAQYEALRARRDAARKASGRADTTPGELARRLDPLTVQTPALELIDSELVAIRDGLAMMFARRAHFAKMMASGSCDGEAVQAAQDEVPQSGNDRLTISMPPQEGKSSRVARYGVLWWMRQFPGLHVGLVSYDGEHASRISYMIRGDIEVFNGEGPNPDLGLRLARNQRAVSRWLLAPPHEGDVYAIGVGGGITGRPIDLLLIDDPVKDIRAADSLLLSSQAWDWWQTAARPRLAPWAPVIVVATRWHEADLIGRMLAKQREDEQAGLEHFDRWREINIPAQAEHDPARGQTDVLGRKPGEFMLSARGRTREQWQATKAATAPRFWSALYQGHPTPQVGEIWLKDWWRRYSEPLWTQQPDGTFRLPGRDTVMLSVDCAFRDKQSSDYVVIQCWCKKGADSYLVYQVWARLSFTATLDALRRVARLFPQAQRKLIEAKANGDAVIDSLKHEMPGVIASEPTQSKLARAEAVSPFIRAGNVHLPTSHLASMQREIAWDPDALILEATGFPNAAHDDQVDATSQALAEMYLRGGQGAAFLTAWQNEIEKRSAAPPPQSRQLPRPSGHGPSALRPGCQHRWWDSGPIVRCVHCAGEKPK
jgi:predicted phage terminase large subunit-like protein